MSQNRCRILANCSDVSLSVLAYCIFGLLPEDDGPLGGISGKDVGGEGLDRAQALSSAAGT